MRASRRRTLQVAAASASGMLVAGCLSEGDPGTGGETPTPTSDPSSDGDEDVVSIDARLHNEAATAHTFAVTIRDADDDVVASDSWDVETDDTVAVPSVGKPGEQRTFAVEVGEASATETVAFDVTPTPGMTDGYVDITYTADGTVEIEFTPADDGEVGDGLSRVDAPPYEISEPECGQNADRDPLWLCAKMAAEPSLPFEQVSTSSSILADEGLRLHAGDADDPQFYATLFEAEADLHRVDNNAGGEAVELIEETDFDAVVVLVAQTGWGSGSVTPHLKRIEETDDGIHAFGCYRRPCGGTADYSMRTVVARIERPTRLDETVVSLTYDVEHRVNFEAGEGVVTVTEEL